MTFLKIVTFPIIVTPFLASQKCHYYELGQYYAYAVYYIMIKCFQFYQTKDNHIQILRDPNLSRRLDLGWAFKILFFNIRIICFVIGIIRFCELFELLDITGQIAQLDGKTRKSLRQLDFIMFIFGYILILKY